MAQVEPQKTEFIKPYEVFWKSDISKAILKTEWKNKEINLCTVGPMINKYPSVMYNEEDNKVYYIGTNGRKKLKIWLDKTNFDRAEMTFYAPIETAMEPFYLYSLGSNNTVYILNENPYIEIDSQGNTGFTFYTYGDLNLIKIADGLVDTYNSEYNYLIRDANGDELNSNIFKLEISDAIKLKLPEKNILENFDEIWVTFVNVKNSGGVR